MLFELFPWVKDGLQSAPAAPVEQGLQEQISRLEALLLAQGNIPIQSPLSTQNLPVLYANRGLDHQSVGKADARTVAENFANSMKSFASGFFD